MNNIYPKNLKKVEISQHIKDLLFTHDRVILQGFGAFIAKYTAAKIDKATNTMSPPSKEIIFDSTVTKNGGLLENHIAIREKITVEDAVKQIDEYVKTIKSKLNAGKEVRFAELGTFSKIKDDQITFFYNPSGNLLLNSFGLPKISLPRGTKIDTPVEKNVKSTKKKAKYVATTKTKKKKRVGLIILLALLLLLLFAFVFVRFIKPTYWEQGKEYLGWNKKDKDKKDDKDTAKLADNSDNNSQNNADNTDNSDNTDANNDSSDNSEPISSDTEDYNNSANYKMPVKNKFYLVIASLKSASLAEAEKMRLAKIGVDVDIIPAEQNNQYRLSLGEYSSASKAAISYNAFHTKHPRISAWLWDYK